MRKRIKDAKAGGDRDHEVAYQQPSGAIADKCAPVLRLPKGPRILGGPVSSHRPRRDADSELQPQLVGDPLFSLDRILTAICSISRRNLSRIGCLPGLDFRFQNSWYPLRCQPTRVSGLTTMRADFQAKKRNEKTNESRAAFVNHPGRSGALDRTPVA